MTHCLSNGMNANPNAFFGQQNLTSGSSNQGLVAPNSATLSNPLGVALDGIGNLYVDGAGNHRLLKFAAPFSKDEMSVFAFGQGDDFSSNSCNVVGSGPSEGTLCTPSGVAKLW
jgi:hypothetical protein